MEQPDDVSAPERGEGQSAVRPQGGSEEVSGDDEPWGNSFAFGFDGSVLAPLPFAALAALCLFLFLRLRKRRLALRERTRLLRSEDTKEAAQALFAYAMELLTALGLGERNCSLFDRAEDICRAAAMGEAELFSVLEIHRRARFGRDALPPGEIGALRDFQERALARLKTTLPWRRRMKLKWVVCLY
jgi:hypothetical protein